jgi:carbon-monoxide dehydrogenase large subunit
MDKAHYRIGQPSLRVEDVRMVRGRGRFTDDVRAAGEIVLVLVRSPHAAARILSIDTDVAAGLPGVLRVATAADLVREGLRTVDVLMRHPGPDGEPMFVPPRIGLADGAVRFVGDPVCAVFADSVAAAREAADLVEVDYEVLRSVAGLEAAIAEGAPQVWNEARGNRAFTVERGDAAGFERALASAVHVVSLDVRIPRVCANALEPRGALAEWNDAEERFTLRIGTHTPHGAREALADVFGVPLGRMRVVVPDLGGSFGMREGGFPEYVVALWGARLLGRPVRWLADRAESLQSDYHARDNITRVDMALDADGVILGLRVDTLANMGAYFSQAGSYVPVGNIGCLSGVYRTPAIHARITGIFTHTSPTAPYRGAGRPEAIYALERAVDHAARTIGIDRLELRRRNLIPADTMPWNTGFLYTYDSGDFAATMAKACAACGWDGFEERRKSSARRGLLRGIGLANAIELAGGPMTKPFEEDAAIRFDADGGVTVHLGTKSHGQGHETSFTQLMVDLFEIDPGRVRIATGDTDALPNGKGSFGSRSLAAGGTALHVAADRIVARAKRLAAHELEAAPDDIDFAGGVFTVAGTDRSTTLAAVCRLAHDHMRLPPGEDVGLSAHASVSAAAPTFPNGAHVCEVEVDPETGQVSILRYLVVDDIGNVVNPALADAQIHGGVAQGIGEAMMEEIRYDAADGQLLTGSFQDYAMPRADDLPFVEIGSSPTPTRANPLGVKGVGESGTVGSMPAFINAVVDALAPLGISHIDMPATPQRVWEAIRAARARRDVDAGT